MTGTQRVLRGELALLFVILFNTLAIVLMLYSGSGISAISSVPYAFREQYLSGLKVEGVSRSYDWAVTSPFPLGDG